MGRKLRGASSWLWLATAAIVVALISALSAGSSTVPPPLSASSARPDGALAAYLWLQRAGYQPRIESAPHLQTLRPERDTLLAISPQADLSGDRGQNILVWVRAGGRLVLATDGTTNLTFLRLLGLSAAIRPPSRIAVVQPLLLAPPVARLQGTSRVVLVSPAPGSVVASTAEGAVLVHRQEGRGEIWLLTAPQLLDNHDIARADNRRLLLNLAGPRGAAIVFDESSAGATPTTGEPDWLTGTTWGIALLFALATLVLYRGITGIRLGPPLIPLTERHRPATEYVRSMAGLLRRAHKREEVLERYQRTLRRMIQQRYGSDERTAVDRPDRERVERLLRPAGRLSEEQLLRRVAHIVEYEEELRRKRA